MECLKQLGLEDVAEVLGKEGVISNKQPLSREELIRDSVRKAEDFKKVYNEGVR